ncbi:MAG: segregation/condensation protein A [Selenomonas sp.]|jgi:segregation and condensation protein A|nr:segregation/condensation protein A [Selenomonas sp.]MDD6120754.1 segregation/condensation protein A [Selenomonadaceae bacterium]MDD7057199.1 segregation/condensation protein A [Selenomonadaceae bacterium]HBT79799.1 segregation/condensation protein A [Selenomonas sp.]
MEKYQFKLEGFEGPLDLLLHLIEKNKIDIYDIPIAELTEQYLAYLDKFREFNIEIASSFLVMAATLLQIKSRMMLPKPPKEDEAEEEDPRRELVERLLEYRKFKQISAVLGEMHAVQEQFVTRDPLPLPVHHLPPGNLSLRKLVEAFHTVLQVKKELHIPEALVQPEHWSIKGQMTHLLDALRAHAGKMEFAAAFAAGSRDELIMTFLALLELLKRQQVRAVQAHVFAPIMLALRPDAPPMMLEAEEAESTGSSK